MDQRLERIQRQCGELCNLRRPTIAHASERFAYSKAAVDCGWLLADGTGIDATLEQPSPPEDRIMAPACGPPRLSPRAIRRATDRAWIA